MQCTSFVRPILYNVNQFWCLSTQPLPHLANPRQRHVCGKKELDGGEFDIAVAGGEYPLGGSVIIEVYDTAAQTWRSGSAFTWVFARHMLGNCAGRTLPVFSG